jgi:uncharacterized lipoprotein YddW (UPF0748 family)
MRAACIAVAIATAMALVAAAAPASAAAPTLKGRAVWAHPGDAGTTEASVRAFVDTLARAHVNTVVMEVKTAAGIFWPSQRFAEAVRPEYRAFDFPAVLIREAHARGIQVHAWFFDFAEGADSPVARQHPEWLARSPDGRPTTDEVLRGRPYRLAWMCPARRPGYTDQWLIPLIREFVERYDVDAVHHDYVRYPGDLAPDTYCFCEYCLREMPKYASYSSQVRPADPLLGPMDRPHLEAHWERSPRVLPPNWDQYGRGMQSRLLLEGSFFPGGNRDLDYFFYEYRAHQIEAFTRQVFEAIRTVKPAIEVSAAVFKNPVQSGRFIGQDWRRFAPWVQYLMPMDYRSHFGGDVDAHLDLLAEAIRQQKEWARDFRHLWIGVAAYQLYDEERQPLVRLRALAAAGEPVPAELQEPLRGVAARVGRVAPGLGGAIGAYARTPGAGAELAAKLDAFLANPPAGYYPPEKLLKVLDRVRAQDVEGVVVFSTSGLKSLGLWPALGEFFGR